MSKFEAAIFNSEVRKLVQDNLHHEFLDDVWAELNYVEIEAPNENEAVRKLKSRYSERQGFEITNIIQVD